MVGLCMQGSRCQLVAVVVALYLSVCTGATGSSASLSNAILKSSASAGSPATPKPSVYDGSNTHHAVDLHQGYPCIEDDDCKAGEFCNAPTLPGLSGGQVCLVCRRRRKRCLRDAMCCPGNYCSNGICVQVEYDNIHPGEIEETIIENSDHGTLDPHAKRTTASFQLHHPKGEEGDTCLRSSDCAEELCCARHFWSKICKPVLKEGQVCTKHRKKGAHGLEIFQRCNCGDGLTCRIQRDHTVSNSPRLHTCQRH
ncbi:dickkopf-related protein 1 [Rhineura floridana]|uniref:dickkopf-related protein 1 n=1 Tax=Rhineura floridana TaxID=261503 RepID=UPI002AC8265A|nr:dickkopf-related protein 1 [Rhineura floridana]